MDPNEIAAVEGIIRLKGDSFWLEGEDEPDVVPNWKLFTEIVEMVNSAGFDLKLVKL